MVSIRSDLFELNVIAQANFLRDLFDGERDIISQQGFAVLNGKDDMVVSIVHIVESPVKAHAPILMRKPRVSTPSYRELAAEPRGKLAKIIKKKGPKRNFREGPLILRGGDDRNGLQGVDRDLLLRAGHPTENREGVSATHLTDHARAHEDDGDGLVIGNIERVEALRDGLGRLLPTIAAERMTDDGVEGLALAVLTDHVAELLRAGVGQFGPVAGRNGSRESGVVVALGVHREGYVLVRCLEYVTASGVHDHRFSSFKVLDYHDSLVAGLPDLQGLYYDSDAVKNSILWLPCQVQTKNQHLCCFVA